MKADTNGDKTRLLEKIDRLPDHLIEQVLTFVARPPAPHPDNAPNAEDQVWLNTDLSNLGAYEPYEWAEGKLEQGKPINYVPGKGLVIDE